MELSKLQKSNRGGDVVCKTCGKSQYYGPKAIKELNNEICIKCYNKSVKEITKNVTIKYERKLLELKNEKNIILTRKTWKNLSNEEKLLAYSMNDEGSTIEEISIFLDINFISLKMALSDKTRNKTKYWSKYLGKKIYVFCDKNPSFTIRDFIQKIGPNPKCYLTGLPIDIKDIYSYELDHIIPRSKNGPNTLENCGLASKIANRMKSNIILEEFISICNQISQNFTP